MRRRRLMAINCQLAVDCRRWMADFRRPVVGQFPRPRVWSPFPEEHLVSAPRTVPRLRVL